MNPGDAIGDYVLASRLGGGFTGSTWTARPQAGGELVVLKIMDLSAAPGWAGVDLFRREAEALRGLSHPGLPRCLGYFEDAASGRLLLVLAMELIEGRNLQAEVDSGRSFSDDEVELILAGLADILAYLGSRRPPVVHRDVNPKNIILRPDGGVALVDFSGVQDALRSAASPGATLVGTAGYTPLEQVAGKATPRSDLFAAAATALFLLARRNPAELPTVALKPDLSAFPGLSPRLACVLGSWLEPEERKRELGAAEAAAILRGESAPPAAPAPRRDEAEARQPRPSRSSGGDDWVEAGGSDSGGDATALPSDSRVAIERDGERLGILIPPAGLRGGGGGVAGGAFALFWLGFVAFWTFSAIAMGAPIFFPLFSIPFWAVGIFMLKSMLKGAFGSSELVLDPTKGVAYRERIVGAGKSRSWPLSDLGRCSIEASSLQIKGRDDRELVLEVGASQIRLGRGLARRELEAMRDAVDSWKRARGG